MHKSGHPCRSTKTSPSPNFNTITPPDRARTSARDLFSPHAKCTPPPWGSGSVSTALARIPRHAGRAPPLGTRAQSRLASPHFRCELLFGHLQGRRLFLHWQSGALAAHRLSRTPAQRRLSSFPHLRACLAATAAPLPSSLSRTAPLGLWLSVGPPCTDLVSPGHSPRAARGRLVPGVGCSPGCLPPAYAVPARPGLPDLKAPASSAVRARRNDTGSARTPCLDAVAFAQRLPALVRRGCAREAPDAAHPRARPARRACRDVLRPLPQDFAIGDGGPLRPFVPTPCRGVCPSPPKPNQRRLGLA